MTDSAIAIVFAAAGVVAILHGGREKKWKPACAGTALVVVPHVLPDRPAIIAMGIILAAALLAPACCHKAKRGAPPVPRIRVPRRK